MVASPTKKPHSTRTSGRKKTTTHKEDIIKANEEELIRNLQELGGIIAEALENAKVSYFIMDTNH